MLLLGASNGDWGGIGYLSAFDAATGKRLWDWYTIPGPGEPGHNTWSGDSWKRGGARDLERRRNRSGDEHALRRSGNPQPDFLGTIRKGSNLYSNSMVALDISGAKPKMKWYHQFIPHDTHDWDPAMPPVLFTGRSPARRAISSPPATRAATSGCSTPETGASSTTSPSARKRARTPSRTARATSRARTRTAALNSTAAATCPRPTLLRSERRPVRHLEVAGNRDLRLRAVLPRRRVPEASTDRAPAT
jgi:hypothetical protein